MQGMQTDVYSARMIQTWIAKMLEWCSAISWTFILCHGSVLIYRQQPVHMQLHLQQG